MFISLVSMPSFAQLTKEQEKERKEMSKMTKSELNAKASKVARKEAKRLKKEGWLVSPGGLPIDKQLDRSYNLQYEIDKNMMPKYIMAEGMSIGETYDAAKLQASEIAKQNLAGQIQTEVTALIKTTLANNELGQEQAASITEIVTASTNLISQSLGRTIPVVELYRVKPNKNKEVLVRLAYDTDTAMKVTKNIIKEELEKKGEDLHEQLDKIMGIK
ncbi:MAG: hypothetical protein IJ213_03410 [Bacteroidales bacterium]|nr:hypothetical protein [Bacteroidales bacterium]